MAPWTEYARQCALGIGEALADVRVEWMGTATADGSVAGVDAFDQVLQRCEMRSGVG